MSGGPYYQGGCVGCEGVPFSGAVLDVCGQGLALIPDYLLAVYQCKRTHSPRLTL